MNKSEKVMARIESYKDHFSYAKQYYYEKKYEDANQRFRKAAEAYMKIYIYNRFGDINGEGILNGELDGQLNSIPNPQKLTLEDMLDLNRQYKFLPLNNIWARIKDLQTNGNTNSHDNDVDPEQRKGDCELCFSQSIELARVLYKDLGEDLPKIFSRSKDISNLISTNIPDCWNELYNFVENFSNRFKYILVAPEDTKNSTKEALSIMANVNWSIIIDFDKSTKETGLYKSFMPEVEKTAVPLLITQINDANLASKASKGTVNWIFAKGLTSIPATIPSDFKSWRGMKYHKFISKIFKESNKQSLSRLFLVFVDTEMSYFDEILRTLDDADEIENDMVKIAYCSTNIDLYNDAQKSLENFDFEYKCFQLSLPELISGVSTITQKANGSGMAVLIPVRTQENQITIKDVSPLYSKLLDSGISIIHQNIGLFEYMTPNEMPSFYKGDKISWAELAAGVDVSRKKFNDICTKIKNLADNSKQSTQFDLYHQPGSGGTTLATRIAYELRNAYPVVVISRFDRNETYDKLSQLASFANRSMIAFVETSDVKLSDIEELRKKLNKNKKIVIFVVIRRSVKRQKDTSSPYLSFLSDKLYDQEEKTRFLAITNQYCKDRKIIEDLRSTPVSESEVINYALAVSTETTYSKSRLYSYVKEYIDLMPKNIEDFVVYVCLVYYYSQKSVSQLLFRKVLKEDLNENLRINKDVHIQKLLVQECENGLPTDYWRPRFSIFAEIVLKVVLGHGNIDDSWKDQLPIFSKGLIDVIKESNQYLVEDTRQLISGVFFDRGHEDVLGIDSAWSNIASSTDLFAQIIRDMGDKTAEQKNILQLIADTFPNEPHYWAHLGRFVFEMAKDPEEYNEALDDIKKAFDEGGDTDPKILHIAGMCLRRKVEYFYRNKIEIDLPQLKELTEDSKRYFEQSRDKASGNIYAYVSEIQLLVCVLDYGMQLSRLSSFREFLLEPSNAWFLEQYETLNELIDDANLLLQQLEQLGKTKKVIESRGKIDLADSKSKSFIGDYKTSLPFLEKLVEQSTRDLRPRLRIVYVRSLLLSKVNGDKRRYKEGWKRLSSPEESKVQDFLVANIRQNPGDVYSLKMWFDFVRYSNIVIPNEELVSMLSIMYDNSPDMSLAKEQSAYYLMILKSIDLIKKGYSIISDPYDEIKKYKDVCRQCSTYDKYAYEWLLDLNGIKGILHYKDKAESTVLIELSGTITSITNQQQGTVTLDCGLEAFFVPVIGHFNKDTDISAKVLFKLGFRHDGLAAYEVHRVGEEFVSENEEIAPPTQIEELEDVTIEEEQCAKQEESDDFLHYGMPSRNSGPKIIGTIDLSKFSRKQDHRDKYL